MTVIRGTPGIAGLPDLLERQRAAGWHEGAQIYVSRRGEVLLDAAIGESFPGKPLRTDHLMLLYSAGKPATAVAILQLWEEGRLGLDDLVAKYVDGWGAGKERCTIRHLLVHTGGFPNAGTKIFDRDLTYAEEVAYIAAWRAEWEPGTAAAYHPSSSWKVLGAIVEAVDGRPIDRYLREQVFDRVGMTDAHLGIPLDEQPHYAERLSPVHWRGHAVPGRAQDGAFAMVPYRIDQIHNLPWHIAKVEPGGGLRAPARELGWFYESLLGYRPPVLEPGTVELMGTVHRHNIEDRVFRRNIPWGLGVQVAFTGGTGRRAFGHGGMSSSRGLCDPEHGLVMVVVTNGLADLLRAEQRLFEVTDAVYSGLGDDVARTRQRAVPVEEVFGFST